MDHHEQRSWTANWKSRPPSGDEQLSRNHAPSLPGGDAPEDQISVRNASDTDTRGRTMGMLSLYHSWDTRSLQAKGHMHRRYDMKSTPDAEQKGHCATRDRASNTAVLPPRSWFQVRRRGVPGRVAMCAHCTSAFVATPYNLEWHPASGRPKLSRSEARHGQ